MLGWCELIAHGARDLAVVPQQLLARGRRGGRELPLNYWPSQECAVIIRSVWVESRARRPELCQT